MRYRDHRYAADTSVRIAYEDEVENLELLDISSTGARIQHLEPLPLGALVTVCYLHLRVPARVVRSSDTETGVRFVTSLSADDLKAIRGSKGGHFGNWGRSGQHGFRELA